MSDTKIVSSTALGTRKYRVTVSDMLTAVQVAGHAKRRRRTRQCPRRVEPALADPASGARLKTTSWNAGTRFHALSHHRAQRVYCSTMSMPTSPLYAACKRSVIGPGTVPPPTGAPLKVDTGQMHRLVDVTNISSAV